MSSSKVRIYELSKELNLDNKEILAVCDHLSISVKSHSSTITELEAEKIRGAAPQFKTSSAAAVRSVAPTPQAPVKPIVIKGKEPGKQQILEVRRHKPIPANEQDSAARMVAPATPPKPLATSFQTPKPMRPAAPVSLRQEGASNKPPAGENKPAVTLEKMDAPSSASSPNGELPRAAEVKPTIPVIMPSLASPPPREVQKPSTSNVIRPVLKSAQSADGQPRREPAQGRPTSSEASARRVRDPGDLHGSDDISDRSPTPILLKKPSQPSRPVRNSSPEIVEHRAAGKPAAPGSDGVIPVLPGDEDLKLRRPTVSRPKRGKAEIEEEEMTELLNKTPKTGTKQKRRTVEEDEDDDLVDGDLANQTTVVDVSQSLVRPPKQKTAKQTRPAPAAASRPGPQKGGGSSRRQNRGRDRAAQAQEPEKPTVISLTNNPTVQELAGLLMLPDTDVIKVLFLKGIAANINQTLDFPTATMVAEELGVTVETVQEESAARKVTEMIDAGDLGLIRRPPVVTIMGHVDHGKTTLLDSIRKTKVAQGEAGGITQHIGAYHVDLEHNGQMQQVVFLDTPGHEAFTAMRARGARVTDIAILVVAADDGVRPQTIEAISHAQAAKVPIIVAINKMDRESAQVDRVKQELTEFGLVSEEWGGDTIMVPVSALKGENLDTLLEMILLVAEVEDLQANPDRPARGTVIEANLDKARGPVATLLVQNGTLRVGDIMVVGSAFGKVRAMIDDRGDRVSVASPSYAVEVLGLNDVPAAGDEFEVFSDEKEARAVASTRFDQQRQTRLQQAMSSRRISLGALSDQVREGELKELNIILKADVQGSLEAILASLEQLPQNEVQVRVLFSAPGEVTETDVDLAAASNAVIIGFNTSLASGSRQAADKASVDIREYNIIYKLLEDIQGAMEGLLDPELVEEPLGQTEVRAVFPVGRGAVAGCYVQSGKLVRNCRVRIRRGNNIVFEGILDSLKRMKDDSKEVNFGYECGVGIDNFTEWKESDIIESYQLVTKRRTLSMV